MIFKQQKLRIKKAKRFLCSESDIFQLPQNVNDIFVGFRQKTKTKANRREIIGRNSTFTQMLAFISRTRHILAILCLICHFSRVSGSFQTTAPSCLIHYMLLPKVDACYNAREHLSCFHAV